jgi:hypothetical protein
MPRLDAAVAAATVPAQGSLFGPHVDGLLSPEEVANPAPVLTHNQCLFAILAALHMPPAQVQAVAEVLDMQPAIVNENLLAAAYLWARRQGNLIAASFNAGSLRQALATLRTGDERITEMTQALRDANPGMTPAQAHFHLLAARLWALVQLGITNAVIPRGIIPPPLGPPNHGGGEEDAQGDDQQQQEAAGGAEAQAQQAMANLAQAAAAMVNGDGPDAAPAVPPGPDVAIGGPLILPPPPPGPQAMANAAGGAFGPPLFQVGSPITGSRHSPK